VAETAGSVGSGGRLAGESWGCDGSVTEEGPRGGDVGKVTILPCSSGSRERGRPPLRMGIRRSTTVSRIPGKGHGRCAEAPGSPTFPASPSPMSDLARRLTGPSPFHDGVPVLGSPEGDQGQGPPGVWPSLMQDGDGSPTSSRPCAASSRKSDFVTSLRRLPHEPLTSRASRGGHTQPGPPRDARDAPRTAAPAWNDAGPGPNEPRPQPPNWHTIGTFSASQLRFRHVASIPWQRPRDLAGPMSDSTT
jgi:hypothetical protein